MGRRPRSRITHSFHPTGEGGRPKAAIAVVARGCGNWPHRRRHRPHPARSPVPCLPAVPVHDRGNFWARREVTCCFQFRTHCCGTGMTGRPVVPQPCHYTSHWPHQPLPPTAQSPSPEDHEWAPAGHRGPAMAIHGHGSCGGTRWRRLTVVPHDPQRHIHGLRRSRHGKIKCACLRICRHFPLPLMLPKSYRDHGTARGAAPTSGPTAHTGSTSLEHPAGPARPAGPAAPAPRPIPSLQQSRTHGPLLW